MIAARPAAPTAPPAESRVARVYLAGTAPTLDWLFSTLGYGWAATTGLGCWLGAPEQCTAIDVFTPKPGQCEGIARDWEATRGNKAKVVYMPLTTT